MKNILITGALGGMGAATTKLLKEQGFNIFCLDLFGEEIPGTTFVKTDLTKMESVENAFKEISKKVDHLDAIVHFGGIYKLNSLVEIDEKDIEKIFNVNFFGVYRVNKVFLPLLREKSKIVITSSELAPLNPLPFTGLYGITKTTVEKYAFSLRMELQLLGIQVVVLRPGAVETKLLGASQKEISDFCVNTKLYKYNSKKFKEITEKVEAKSIPTQKIAKLVLKIINKEKPKYIYNINRNFGLKLLSALPKRWQTAIIKNILKEKKKK